MTDNLRDKPVHELCVDKTSCQAEQQGDKSTPTYDLTKDSIRKKLEQLQSDPNSGAKNTDKP